MRSRSGSTQLHCFTQNAFCLTDWCVWTVSLHPHHQQFSTDKHQLLSLHFLIFQTQSDTECSCRRVASAAAACLRVSCQGSANKGCDWRSTLGEIQTMTAVSQFLMIHSTAHTADKLKCAAGELLSHNDEALLQHSASVDFYSQI